MRWSRLDQPISRMECGPGGYLVLVALGRDEYLADD
jgi:hypothetical protein